VWWHFHPKIAGPGTQVRPYSITQYWTDQSSHQLYGLVGFAIEPAEAISE
jgi:folate-dependent tRNA-U54 methylase TrmFO/GidA